MNIITIEIRVPDTEFNTRFVEGMAARMATSYFKYGEIRNAFPYKVDALASLKKRLEEYEKTGNTEYLMDVANFAMIEFSLPCHTKAHFDAQDSNTSPGRKWIGEVDFSDRHNDANKWVK